MTLSSGFVLSPKAVTNVKISNVIKFGSTIDGLMGHEIDKTNCAASQPEVYIDLKEELLYGWLQMRLTIMLRGVGK